MEECSNRERRGEIELKSLRERLESERESWEKELTRNKSEVVKLKGLLAVSEEQLSQCEDYINKLNLQVK
jgi:CII-binding regulator of phage lambda lysogenization HflD